MPNTRMKDNIKEKAFKLEFTNVLVKLLVNVLEKLLKNLELL